MVNENKPVQITRPWWFFAPIFLAPVLLFLPALIPGKTLFWGITSIQFIPWHWEALKLIQAGEIPLWNNLNGMGAPLAANYQSCLFYPPTWLTFLAGWIGGLSWLAWSHGLLIVGHLIWAGWGMRKLTQRLGLGAVPQLICGLSYGLCGYLVARGSFLTMVQAGAWIPWILLAASQFAAPIHGNTAAARSPFTPRSILGLGLAFSGQWLSGHAQLAWYTLLFCLAWLITGALVNGGFKKLLSIILPVALSGLLGLLISSVQLIPTLEYFAQSQRSGVIDYQTALSYSFWPWRVITLIFPDIFGNPGAGDYWGYASFWEDAIYLGLLPFVLAAYYVIRRIRRKQGSTASSFRPLFWFCLISSAIILILALGWNTPVFPWLFNHVLTFGFFNGPARWMVFVEVCLILLAGLGAQEWIEQGMLSRKWVNLSLAGVLAMVLSAAAAWVFLPEIKVSFKYSVISAGVFLLGYLIFALFKPGPSGETGLLCWRFWIVCWLAIDLLWAGSRLNPAVSADLLKPTQSQTENPQNSSRYYFPGSTEKDQRFERFFRFEDIRPRTDWQNLSTVLLPDINILSNLPMLNNFDPMVPDRFSEYLTAIESTSLAIGKNLLATAGVGQIARVNPLDMQDLDWTRSEAYPRARMVYCAAIFQDGEKSLQWMKSAAEAERLAGSLVLENGSVAKMDCDESVPDLTGLPDLSPKSNRQEYQISGNRADGWLLIADTWYPGWKVKLDGQPAELLRADFVFMAVHVPAGDHRIELDFQPLSFTTGLILTIAGLCAAITLGFLVKNSNGGSQ